MKSLIFICCILSLCMPLFGQDVQDQCGSHPNLWRDRSGSLKWLTPEEIQTRAVSTVFPEPVAMPSGTQYAGVVGARIMINTSGNVVCLWSASGHPMMIPAAMRALHQWKFKPMVVYGKAVEYLAQIKVPVRSTTVKD